MEHPLLLTRPLPAACPPGFYKVSSRRPLCSPCPEHSRALENASTFCACLDSYARSPTDPPWASCTRECASRTHGGGQAGRGRAIKLDLELGRAGAPHWGR